jgi:DNA-directed RNA polymerase subunit K/omega
MAMAEMNETPETTSSDEVPAAPRPKAPPIESRFLFVDVAALRAKQLRRGALLRLDDDAESVRNRPFKCERLAMEEVKRGLVAYDVPKAPVEPI